MDPEVEQYVSEARALGATDELIKAKLAEKGISWEPPPPSNDWDDGARAFAQGATLNTADDMLDDWTGNREAGDKWRAQEAAFAKAHPWVSGGLNMAGGALLPAGAIMRALGGARGVGRLALAGSAVGAGSGAVAGAGAAEGGLKERLSAAKWPAVFGGLFGAAVPGGATAARAFFKPGSRALARVDEGVRGAGGPEGVKKIAKQYADQGRGEEIVLADMGDDLRAAADFSANNNDAARGAIRKVVTDRQEDASQRVLDDVYELMGDPEADEILKGLRASKKDWADGPEGYGGLRDKNPVIVPAMAEDFNKLMQTSAVREAWTEAQEVGLIGPMEKSGSVSFDVMQGALARLKNAKDMAWKSGAKDLAPRLDAAHKALTQQMRLAVRGFDKVHDEYLKRSEAERLVEEGQAWFNAVDTRGLARRVARLEPDELTRLREGIASELIVQLRGAQTNQKVYNRLVAASPRTKDKLELIFGNEKNFKTFMDRMEGEQGMGKLMAAVGGSDTHRRGAVADAGETAVGVGADMMSGGANWAAAGLTRRLLPPVIRKKTARDMQPILTTRGRTAIDALMDDWNRRGRMVPGVGGAAVGGGLLGAELYGE